VTFRGADDMVLAYSLGGHAGGRDLTRLMPRIAPAAPIRAA
jgi:hypothetical protein